MKITKKQNTKQQNFNPTINYKDPIEPKVAVSIVKQQINYIPKNSKTQSISINEKINQTKLKNEEAKKIENLPFQISDYYESDYNTFNLYNKNKVIKTKKVINSNPTEKNLSSCSIQTNICNVSNMTNLTGSNAFNQFNLTHNNYKCQLSQLISTRKDKPDLKATFSSNNVTNYNITNSNNETNHLEKMSDSDANVFYISKNIKERSIHEISFLSKNNNSKLKSNNTFRTSINPNSNIINSKIFKSKHMQATSMINQKCESTLNIKESKSKEEKNQQNSLVTNFIQKYNYECNKKLNPSLSNKDNIKFIGQSKKTISTTNKITKEQKEIEFKQYFNKCKESLINTISDVEEEVIEPSHKDKLIMKKRITQENKIRSMVVNPLLNKITVQKTFCSKNLNDEDTEIKESIKIKKKHIKNKTNLDGNKKFDLDNIHYILNNFSNFSGVSNDYNHEASVNKFNIIPSNELKPFKIYDEDFSKKDNFPPIQRSAIKEIKTQYFQDNKVCKTTINNVSNIIKDCINSSNPSKNLSNTGTSQVNNNLNLNKNKSREVNLDLNSKTTISLVSIKQKYKELIKAAKISNNNNYLSKFSKNSRISTNKNSINKVANKHMASNLSSISITNHQKNTINSFNSTKTNLDIMHQNKLERNKLLSKLKKDENITSLCKDLYKSKQIINKNIKLKQEKIKKEKTEGNFSCLLIKEDQNKSQSFDLRVKKQKNDSNKNVLCTIREDLSEINTVPSKVNLNKNIIVEKIEESEEKNHKENIKDYIKSVKINLHDKINNVLQNRCKKEEEKQIQVYEWYKVDIKKLDAEDLDESKEEDIYSICKKIDFEKESASTIYDSSDENQYYKDFIQKYKNLQEGGKKDFMIKRYLYLFSHSKTNISSGSTLIDSTNKKLLSCSGGQQQSGWGGQSSLKKNLNDVYINSFLIN